MSDQATELVSRLQRAWNEKNWEALRDLHTRDWIDHNMPEGFKDLDGLHASFQLFTAAFPDLHFRPVNIISDGDFVSSHYEITGTHIGDFMGLPPTGREFRIRGITQLEMQDGLCAEAWTVLDQLSLMQQIGAVPAPAGPGT